jgi:hypothetical protein
MTESTIENAVKNLSGSIVAKCANAVVEVQEQAVRGYDAYIVVELPSEWTPSHVSEFQDWARSQAYEILMDNDIDIRVEAHNLTRNQQELVKWIFAHYPDVQEEELPAGKIRYNRDAAREWYNDHDGSIEERLIQASKSATRDRQYIEHKYGLRYGT